MNLKRFREVQNEGLAHSNGLAAYENRKQGRQAIYAYENVERELPEEYAARLAADPAALSFRQSARPSYRKVATPDVGNGRLLTHVMRRTLTFVRGQVVGHAGEVPAAEKIDVRRAADRFTTKVDWLDSKHSFSFGQHYDPDNVGHGLLLVNNDDVVRPGTGFDTHPHRDMEIVTWVLRGSLVHQDSTGHAGLIYPGLAQRMSAGTGILHSERNDARGTPPGPPDEHPGWLSDEHAEHEDPVHFVQMWVVPDEPGITPGYEQLEIDDELMRGDLVAVASGMDKHADDAAIRIRNKYAALYAARLAPGRTVSLPEAPYLHLFVAQGTVDLEDAGALAEGDAVRFTSTGGQQVTATGEGAEILVWEMHAALRAS